MLLKIYTEKHMDILNSFFKHYELLPSDLEISENFAYMEFDDFYGIIRLLPELLEDAILSQNPVTKSSDALKQNIKTRVFLPFRKDIEKDIFDYFIENNYINMEGYINFRLKEYVHLVDLVLYSAIRKFLN